MSQAAGKIAAYAFEADRRAELAMQKDDFDAAIDIYRDAYNKAHQEQDKATSGFLFRRLMTTRAHKEVVRQNFDAGLRVYDKAIELAEKVGDSPSAAFFYRQFYDTKVEKMLYQRSSTAAKEVYKRAMAAAEGAGDDDTAAYFHWQLTNLYILYPDKTTPRHAIRMVNRTFNIYEEDIQDDQKLLEVASDLCSNCASTGNQEGIDVCSKKIEQAKKRMDAAAAPLKPQPRQEAERPQPKPRTKFIATAADPEKRSSQGMHAGDELRSRHER